jgi:cbb3-type cytochrome oxidase subunit 3
MNQQPNSTTPNFSAQDPLAHLQDIQLPEAIGLWPPAWGWWCLTVFMIVMLASIIFLVRRQKKRNGYRTQALTELEKINQAYRPEKKSEYLQAVSILLRRTAISGFGAEFNSSIQGDDWLVWLDAQNPKNTASFKGAAGNALAIGLYQKAPEFDQHALYSLTKQWIQKHRNQWQKKPASKTIASEVKSYA